MAIVRSPDGDTEPFNISAGVLQGDTLAPFLFILCLDYVIKTSIDRPYSLGFTLQRARSRRHPATYLTDVDYAYDIALFADSPEDKLQKYQNSESLAKWKDWYYQILETHDEFGYFKKDGFYFELDSKENFDQNYESNWYYYYK